MRTVSLPSVTALPDTATEGDTVYYCPQPNIFTAADSHHKVYIDISKILAYLTDHPDAGFYGNIETGSTNFELMDASITDIAMNIYLADGKSISMLWVFDENGKAVFSPENSDTNLVAGSAHLACAYPYVLLGEVSESDYYYDGNVGEYTPFFVLPRFYRYTNGSWLEMPYTDLETPNTVDCTLTDTSLTYGIMPNVNYNFGEVDALSLALLEGEADKLAEYKFSFISGETATVLTLPSNVTWTNREVPDIQPGANYTVRILGGVASYETDCADSTAVDLSNNPSVDTLADGAYYVTVGGEISIPNQDNISVNANATIIKNGESIVVYDATEITKANNWNTETEIKRGITEDDFEVNTNATVTAENGNFTISATNINYWAYLGTETSNIIMEFQISNRGLLIFEKDSTYYYFVDLVGVGNKGQKGSLELGTNSVGHYPNWVDDFFDINEAYNNTTTETMFRVEKNGSNLKIYADDGTGYALILEYDSCNFIGFIDYKGTLSALSNCGIINRSYGTNVKVFKSLENSVTANENSTVPLNERFNAYNVLCIGDSITEKNFRADTNWTEYINNWLNFNSIENDGKSGTGIVKDYGSFGNWYSRIDNYTGDYDLILIMGNMNDYSGQVFTNENLGTFGDNTFSTEYGALKLYLDKLIAKYPTAKIGWIISTPRQYAEWEAETLWGRNSLFEGATEAIKDVCGHYSIPVLDLFHESNLMP